MGNAPPASADSTVVLRAELAGICGGVLLGELGGDASTLRDGEPLGAGPLPPPRRLTGTTAVAAAPTATAGQVAPAAGPAPCTDVRREPLAHLDRMLFAEVDLVGRPVEGEGDSFGARGLVVVQITHEQNLNSLCHI